MAGFFAAVVILGFFAFFGYLISRNIRIRKKGIEADAVITDVKYTQESGEDDAVTYHPIYHVKYRLQNGLEIEARLGDEPEGLKVGDSVQIKYLPEKPEFVLLAKK